MVKGESLVKQIDVLEEELTLEKDFHLDDEELHPFIAWSEEDMNVYPSAKDEGFIDDDDDFLVGNSGGFLMKMDFIFVNTEIFTETAKHYDEHKCYTRLIKGTPEYRQWRKREARRRIEGLTANCKLYKKDVSKFKLAKSKEERDRLLHPLRITGNHYNFLNYGRLLRTPSADEIEEQKRQGYKRIVEIEGFPRFWDSHYWNYKTDEFCEKNGNNITKGKARRKGYSFMAGSDIANLVNLYPKININIVAYLSNYITSNPKATTRMAKTCIQWYEDKTPWKRGILSHNIDAIRLGYNIGTEGHNEYGSLSSITSASCKDNASAAIGTGSIKIYVEESGKFPNLLDVLAAIESSNESGRIKVGETIKYGTGGVKNADWMGFERVFYNPKAFGDMPFENVWSKNSRTNLCGFFHPNIWSLEDDVNATIDQWGNSDLRLSWELDKQDKKEAKQYKTLGEWVLYCSQRANSPDEAFSGGTDNMYNSPELQEHLKMLENSPDYKFYQDGTLQLDGGVVNFVANTVLEARGKSDLVHPYITDVPFDPKKDFRGCLRLYYSIYRDDLGNIPDNLYAIEYDPVGVDKDKDKITNKYSLASLRIKMLPNNVTPFKIINKAGLTVATWCGRHSTMAEDDRFLLWCCMFANAKAMIEVNRGETLKNFRQWKVTRWLSINPIQYIHKYNTDRGDNSIGVNLTPRLKLDGYGYLYDELYEVLGESPDGKVILGLHYELDIPFVKELRGFHPKKNHDRISSRIVGTYDVMARDVIGIKANKTGKDTKGFWARMSTAEILNIR